jgi:hypothetical protein
MVKFDLLILTLILGTIFLHTDRVREGKAESSSGYETVSFLVFTLIIILFCRKQRKSLIKDIEKARKNYAAESPQQDVNATTYQPPSPATK